MEANKGTLYLIPTVISDDTENIVLSPQIQSVLPRIRYFLAENQRTTRRALSRLKVFDSIESLSIEQLDKDTPPAAMTTLMEPLLKGYDMGLMSESGCPGIADPGALAAEFAHRNNLRVIPLVGPSSILLALMASGLNGQNFCFHGYLPVEQKPLANLLKALERESKALGRTQIFIETPYRNNAMIRQLLNNLQPSTRLTIAVDVTGSAEFIKTKSVYDWSKVETLLLPKAPAVFLFHA